MKPLTKTILVAISMLCVWIFSIAIENNFGNDFKLVIGGIVGVIAGEFFEQMERARTLANRE